jgi:hypothetical protein
MDSNIAHHCLAVLCACFQVRTVPGSASECAAACMLGKSRRIVDELVHMLIDGVIASIKVVHEGQRGWNLV